MDPAVLREFEVTAELALGNGPVDQASRATAAGKLAVLGTAIDHIPTIQNILDASFNDYAIVAASRCLLTLVTEHWNAFTTTQRVDVREWWWPVRPVPAPRPPLKPQPPHSPTPFLPSPPSPKTSLLAGNYLLTLLANKGPKLLLFSVQQVISVVTRLTKYAWLDDAPTPAPIRQIVAETGKFLQATYQHCLIGMRLLISLVQEMNHRNTNRTLTQHRKIAVSFRDQALLEVFEVSLSMLNNLATRAIVIQGLPPQEADRFEDQLLDLSLQLLDGCMSFDFIGVFPDESSDESNSLQVPNSWAERLKNGASLRLLFNLYKGSTTGKVPIIPDQAAPPVAAAAAGLGAGAGAGGGGLGPAASPGSLGGGPSGLMQPSRDFRLSADRAAQTLDCISLMVSVRRSLFPTDTDRRKFLTHIIRGIYEILREEQGLRSEECYHRFCRLLSRIKSNYPLTDLIHVEGYAEWLALTARFTIQACSTPGWSSNSMHYILGFWSKLVAGVPYANASGAAGIPVSGSVVKQDALLGDYVPQIVGAYVKGRIDRLRGQDQEGALEELDDLEQVEDQLEQLPLLCRFQYAASVGMLQSVMDPCMLTYGDMLAAVRTNMAAAAADANARTALRLQECQLAWMVAIVGAVVGGGGSAGMGTTSAGDEAYDAELIRRVLTLITRTDQQLTQALAGMAPSQALQSPLMALFRVDARLELAMCYFMDQFRRAFINDASGMPTPPPASASSAAVGSSAALLRSAARSADGVAAGGSSSSSSAGAAAMSGGGAGGGGTGAAAGGAVGAGTALTGAKSYAELLETASGRQRTFLTMFQAMGLGEHTGVVEALLLKLANNLRFWGSSDEIIRRSLDVFHELVYSFASGRLLLTLPSVAGLLTAHGPAHFPFLANPSNVRFRTAFYQSLARLVFFQDDSEKFEPFMAPLIAVLESLAPPIHGGVRSEEVMRTLVGSARDLRGVVGAAHNKASYLQCFEALHPKHVETLIRGIDLYADQPPVTTAVLKLVAELVFQRGQRIQFGSNSPNGILLFKAASQAIVAYGTRVLSVQPGSSPYANKYKGIAVCAQILARCMDGGFVNFGVFALYGDRTFDQALDATLKLLISIPLKDIMVRASVQRKQPGIDGEKKGTGHAPQIHLLPLPPSPLSPPRRSLTPRSRSST
jgi:hypothetical protein